MALTVQFTGWGPTREADAFTGLGSDAPAFTEQDPWYYEMPELGYNYRITDMQAALGVSQLRRLEPWVAKRHVS